jgi:hypothetical protein
MMKPEPARASGRRRDDPVVIRASALVPHSDFVIRDVEFQI